MPSQHGDGRAGALREQVFVPVTKMVMMAIVMLYTVPRAEATSSYAAVSRTSVVARCGCVHTRNTRMRYGDTRRRLIYILYTHTCA